MLKAVTKITVLRH